MKHAKLSIGISAFFIVWGCTTTLSDAERRSIQTISVGTHVEAPPVPWLPHPDTSKAHLLGGPIVGEIVSRSENPESIKFQKHLEENKIDIREIVRTEFVSLLTTNRVFPPLVPQGGHANFELIVEAYGLQAGIGLRPSDRQLKPVMKLRGKLTTPDGKVLWHNTAIVNVTSDIHASPLAQYYFSAELAQQAFRKAAGIAVMELVNDASRIWQ